MEKKKRGGPKALQIKNTTESETGDNKPKRAEGEKQKTFTAKNNTQPSSGKNAGGGGEKNETSKYYKGTLQTQNEMPDPLKVHGVPPEKVTLTMNNNPKNWQLLEERAETVSGETKKGGVRP